MRRPRALDLFCCAGGASMGLHRAGFDVVGVDLRPQPHYPFAFVQGDALAPPVNLADFDFVWASPPCQAYTSAGGYQRQYCGTVYPDLVAAPRAMLAPLAVPTCIENVVGAPLRVDLELDGTMFPGLRVVRRRWFELNFRAPFLLTARRPGLVVREGWACVAGNGTSSWLFRRGVRQSADHWRRCMGIDWMTKRELAQAIPPPYAEFIGRAALAEIERAAA